MISLKVTTLDPSMASGGWRKSAASVGWMIPDDSGNEETSPNAFFSFRFKSHPPSSQGYFLTKTRELLSSICRLASSNSYCNSVIAVLCVFRINLLQVLCWIYYHSICRPCGGVVDKRGLKVSGGQQYNTAAVFWGHFSVMTASRDYFQF